MIFSTLFSGLYLAINRTLHFGVWSALTPALNIRCVRITAPALHLLLKKKQIFKIFVKNNFKKYIIFFN